jgi:hypothetical protein
MTTSVTINCNGGLTEVAKTRTELRSTLTLGHAESSKFKSGP